MSERLTHHWTETAAQAYGKAGERGRTAELLVMDILTRNNIEYEDFEDDYQYQVAGIDILTDKLSIDVKGNLYKGHFYIENGTTGWLFNPNKTSDVILHVDPNTEEVVWYYRSVAASKIRSVNDYGEKKSIFKVSDINFREDFMYRDWESLFKLLQSC